MRASHAIERAVEAARESVVELEWQGPLGVSLEADSGPAAHAKMRASGASEPRDWSAPSERRARARVGESEGRSPSD